MTTSTMLLVGLILLPAAGLATWAGFVMTALAEDLRSFGGFEARHFKIGLQATSEHENATWPAPG